MQLVLLYMYWWCVLLLLLLQVSPREYLETALSPSAGAGAAVEAKNQVRMMRDCGH
jgi:hypothetical protein